MEGQNLLHKNLQYGSFEERINEEFKILSVNFNYLYHVTAAIMKHCLACMEAEGCHFVEWLENKKKIN